MINFTQRLIRIKTDIRDLKTAQLVQSNSAASVAHGTLTVPGPGIFEWLIEYEDDGESTPPLIDIPNISFFGLAILDYDPNTNTQKLQFVWQENYDTDYGDFLVVSSRKIRSFTRLS